MPLLNFKKQFAPSVKLGLGTLPNPPADLQPKKQTIRVKRKHPFKVGDLLFIYTGLRTRHTEKLGEATCYSVSTIMINNETGKVYNILNNGQSQSMHSYNVEALARSDGFQTVEDFFQFFKENDDNIIYQLIKW